LAELPFCVTNATGKPLTRPRVVVPDPFKCCLGVCENRYGPRLSIYLLVRTHFGCFKTHPESVKLGVKDLLIMASCLSSGSANLQRVIPCEVSSTRQWWHLQAGRAAKDNLDNFSTRVDIISKQALE
jgi:hypothetical protein